MAETIKILLQTTIPYDPNNWHIGRFSLLSEHLRSMRRENGDRLFDVTTRDREPDVSGNDLLLATIDELDLDEVWLTAADSGDGLSTAECEALTRFRRKGGGIVSMRDHMDLGSSLCLIDGIGRANFFHSTNLDPDETRRKRDDVETDMIDFPNYHSGRNGDFHEIVPPGPVHRLLKRQDGTAIRYFPAHPHEGAVGAPADDPSASVIACGTSKVTRADFNLVVTFERRRDENGDELGRAAAHSSFHHFADYNWDPAMGCPDFVTETAGDGYAANPGALDDIKTYVGNLALWLAPSSIDAG